MGTDRAGAARAGLLLRPTELLVFGNARGGTPLMQAAQTIGIDLPLKALVWQDDSGQALVSSNSTTYLATRYRLPDELLPNIGGIDSLLARVLER